VLSLASLRNEQVRLTDTDYQISYRSKIQVSEEGDMDLMSSRQAMRGELAANGPLTRISVWVMDRNLPFLVTSLGMIVMLLWAGAFKMTTPGAEGIIPLVSNSPLIWWHFKLFGPYIGSDIIGATEVTAAILFIVGYVRPKAGLVGALITTLMFFITSTMLLSTPGATIEWKGLRYMNNLGLFLFKDVISLGVSLYFISYYGRKAMLAESRTNG
jgi:uncharacterized membrane protein YkgB